MSVPAGTVRKPTAELIVEGTPIRLSAWSAIITRNAQSDSFNAEAPLQGCPKGIDYWSTVGPVEVTLRASNDGGGMREVLVGVLDHASVGIDAHGGAAVFLRGRDNTAKLLDTKRTQKDPNKKASEIVQEIAQKHGLTAEVDATDDQAGKKLTDENAHLIDNDTDWNTLARLAEREGAFLFLKKRTLYFKQPGSDEGEGSYTARIVPPRAGQPAAGDVLGAKLLNNCHLGQEIKSTVRSAHSYKEKSVSKTKTVKAGSGSAGGGGEGRKLEFIENRDGLTDEQAEKIARKKAEEVARHELAVDLHMVGDVTLDARMKLQVQGTGSAWDQSYFIDSIHFAASATEEGFRMDVRAKNKRDGRSVE